MSLDHASFKSNENALASGLNQSFDRLQLLAESKNYSDHLRQMGNNLQNHSSDVLPGLTLVDEKANHPKMSGPIWKEEPTIWDKDQQPPFVHPKVSGPIWKEEPTIWDKDPQHPFVHPKVSGPIWKEEPIIWEQQPIWKRIEFGEKIETIDPKDLKEQKDWSITLTEEEKQAIKKAFEEKQSETISPKDLTREQKDWSGTLTEEEMQALKKLFVKDVKHNSDGTNTTTYIDGSVITTDSHNQVVKAQYSDGTGLARMADGSTHHWGPKAQDNYDEARQGDKVVRTYKNGCIEETYDDGSIVVELPARGSAGHDKIYISKNGNSQYTTLDFFRQLTNLDFGKVIHYNSPQEALEAARAKYEFPR